MTMRMMRSSRKSVSRTTERRTTMKKAMKKAMKYALVAWLLQDEIKMVAKKIGDLIGRKGAS
jgi:hypothetical protein